MASLEKNIFWTKSLSIKINSEEIKYLYYTKPALAFKVPIVIINDGFYEYSVMEELLTSLKNEFPVYFVTLPDFDENNKSSTAPLNNLQYSNLIKGFCDTVGIDRINLLGISFSAVLAYNFAASFPEYVNRLILQGITKSLRESTKLLIKENIKLLENKDYKKFAASFSMNIMNFSRKEMINNGKEIHNKFYKKYQSITKSRADIILSHLKRMLFQNELKGIVHCPTLIMAGQYDHFTTPYENFKVSKACTDSTFGILKRVDHFAVLEKNKMMSKIYNSFFSNNEIGQFSGIDIYKDDFYPTSRRQIEPRYRWGECVTARVMKESEQYNNVKEFSINIIDLNGQGCKIHIPNLEDFQDIQKIEIDIFPNCTINLLLFKQNENNTFHGIFNHQSIPQTVLFLDQFANKICDKKSFKAA